MKGHRKLEKDPEKEMNFSTVPWYLQTEHFFQVTLRAQIVIFPKIREVWIKHKNSFTAICVCVCVLIFSLLVKLFSSLSWGSQVLPVLYFSHLIITADITLASPQDCPLHVPQHQQTDWPYLVDFKSFFFSLALKTVFFSYFLFFPHYGFLPKYIQHLLIHSSTFSTGPPQTLIQKLHSLSEA